MSKEQEKRENPEDRKRLDCFAGCGFAVLTLPSDMLISSLIKGLNYDIIYA